MARNIPQKHKIARPLIAVSVTLCASLVVVEIMLRTLIPQTKSGYNWRTAHDESKIAEEMETLAHDAGVSETNFNIYYFGGSTIKGEPYRDNGFARLVSAHLGDRIGEREIVNVTVGDIAQDIEFNVQRMRHIASHPDVFYPSLFIVYSGHNEFLWYHDDWGFQVDPRVPAQVAWIAEHSAIARLMARVAGSFRLEADEREFFDAPVVPEEKRQEILAEYEYVMTHEVPQVASEVPVIVSTVAGNDADFEPNRSVYCNGGYTKTAFAASFENGMKNLKEKKPYEALEAFERSAVLCDTFADLHFRMGDAYRLAGDYQSARSHYHRATDLDGMPIRAVSVQNAAIRSLKPTEKLAVADAELALWETSEDGLIGDALMIDGHHPNIDGYGLVTRAIAQAVEGLVDGAQTTRLSREQIEDILIPDDHQRFSTAISRAFWFIRLATWRYDPALRLEKAEGFVRLALEVSPDATNAYHALAVIHYLRGDIHLAQQTLDTASALNDAETRAFINEPWVRQVISRAEMQ